MSNQFKITLANPNDFSDTYELLFDLDDTPIVEKWKQKINLVNKLNIPIDNPTRFYGMNSAEEDAKISIDLINKNIQTINSFKPLIDRTMTSISDTDTLNLLHHVFEEYHGLLNEQNSDFWLSAPPDVRKALCDLNINVHRVENVHDNNISRLVVTYFALPKTDKLDIDDYNNLDWHFNFGDLFLNYVEVGKTLEDLWRDDDQYIHHDAFKPWEHYSADFTVRLHNNLHNADITYDKCWKYFEKNSNFFEKLGYPYKDIRLNPGFIKLGKLIYNDEKDMLDKIRTHQFLSNVRFL
jgi:hypothetical protein